MTKQEVTAHLYGEIVDGKWSQEANFCMTVKIGEEFNFVNTATGLPTRSIYMNRNMAKPFLNALGNLLHRGIADQLKSFDGCMNQRKIRGTSDCWSAHSWALAIDLNASTNKLGTAGDMTPEFVKCFTDEGFVWGGTFSRNDPMHFSWMGF